eukprot:4526187-Pyramimonas_sp.AAC.1
MLCAANAAGSPSVAEHPERVRDRRQVPRSWPPPEMQRRPLQPRGANYLVRPLCDGAGVAETDGAFCCWPIQDYQRESLRNPTD